MKNIDTISVFNGARGWSRDPVYYDRIQINNGRFVDPVHGTQIGSTFKTDSIIRLGMRLKQSFHDKQPIFQAMSGSSSDWLCMMLRTKEVRNGIQKSIIHQSASQLLDGIKKTEHTPGITTRIKKDVNENNAGNNLLLKYRNSEFNYSYQQVTKVKHQCASDILAGIKREKLSVLTADKENSMQKYESAQEFLDKINHSYLDKKPNEPAVTVNTPGAKELLEDVFTRHKINTNKLACNVTMENDNHIWKTGSDLLKELGYFNFPEKQKAVNATANTVPVKIKIGKKEMVGSTPIDYQLSKARVFVSRFNYAAAGKIENKQNAVTSVACAGVDPSYTYDILNRVTSMTSPAGITGYHYDTISGLLDRITSPEGKEFIFSYNKGQISTLQYPNGITAGYNFDGEGNLQSINYNRSGSALRSYNYKYDKNGMRDTMIDNDGMHAYTYDPLYQILQATHPRVQDPLEQFSYDAVGNRTGGAYRHNEVNQLLEDNSCRYTYDADGNMTEKVSKITGDTTHFVYDIENTLTEIRKPGQTVRYTYDALGRRMSKEVNNVVTKYQYSGEDVILELNGGDTVTASYTHGPNTDDPLMMHRDGKNYYYLKDGLGSVAAITDSTANVVKEYKYSVYGKIVEEAGDPGFVNPYTFTAREYEKETGLYFYRARFYNPEIGRFLNEDPIGFSGYDYNFYRYVANDPINWNDPYGYFNPAKGFVSLLNAANAGRLYASGGLKFIAAAGLSSTGVGALPALGSAALGAWNIKSAIAAQRRAQLQWEEALKEDWSDARLRNLLGILPFGQQFDDPCEPMPLEFLKNKMNNINDFLTEIGTLFGF